MVQLEIKTWLVIVQETQNDTSVGIGELGIRGDVVGLPSHRLLRSNHPYCTLVGIGDVWIEDISLS